jgi:chromosome segregation ATPase
VIGLWVFLKAINPRTWLIVGLVAVVGWGGVHLYHLGAEHEAVKAKNAVLEGDKLEAQKEAEAFRTQMLAAEQTEQSAMATINAQNARLAALDSRLVTDRQRVTTSIATVGALPDQQLVGDIAQRLGKRQATDNSPTLYAVELREIDIRLAELPPLQDQLTDLSTKVDTLQQRSTAQDQDIGAIKTERAALLIYATQLYGHYEKAYSLAQPHQSLFVKIVTLGLRKPKQLNIPAPASIPVPAQ